MIDVYYWPTPNGHKIIIFLEEAHIPYKIIPVNISQKEQFKPDFLKISPNNKMPAIVDHSPQDAGQAIAIFESGAILIYLADKTQLFLSDQLRERYATLQWLFWQVAGLGPMAGQNHHFNHYAPEKIPYAIERYINETTRLYTVLDKQLADQEFITGKYSIADMACYPWIVMHENQSQNLDQFPNIKRWFTLLSQRPAIQRAYEIGKEIAAK